MKKQIPILLRKQKINISHRFHFLMGGGKISHLHFKFNRTTSEIDSHIILKSFYRRCKRHFSQKISTFLPTLKISSNSGKWETVFFFLIPQRQREKKTARNTSSIHFQMTNWAHIMIVPDSTAHQMTAISPNIKNTLSWNMEHSNKNMVCFFFWPMLFTSRISCSRFVYGLGINAKNVLFRKCSL